MTDPSNATSKPPRLRVALMFITLTLLLVVTPYASWYYLNKGLDYRKDQLSLLDEFGKMPQAVWTDYKGELIDTKSWTNQISLVAISTTVDQWNRQLTGFERLQKQFHDRSDVRYYHFTSDNLEGVIFDQHTDSSIVIIPMQEDQLTEFSGAFDRTMHMTIENKIILVDRNQLIRQGFSTESEKELKDLVQVVAVLLPPKKVERPNVKRESEK